MSSENKKTVLIVAGGKGLRMNTDIPKQFIEVSGLPVLMHTLCVFHRYDPMMKIVLVLPLDQIEYWQALCKKYAFTLSHQVVTGGHTRFQSVKNGLQAVSDGELVAIHDGVRPLVSVATIARCFEAASLAGAVVPVVELVDSICRVDGDRSEHVDRSAFRLVQTPQVFESVLLKKAYSAEYQPCFTDDASVVEHLGKAVKLVAGNRENIKITTPYDLIVAEAVMQNKICE